LSNFSFPFETLKKKHLVLDLDETMIHGITKKDITHQHKVQFYYHGEHVTYFIAVRPGLSEFLEEMQKYFVLNVFTCSDLVYAESILEKIGARKYFQKIYSRVNCKKGQDKNLSKDLSVLGIDMADVILVDDLERHIEDNMLNALKISDYIGGKTDGELKKIGRFLKKLALCQDVRSVGEKYQLFLEGRQFVSESDLFTRENPVSPLKKPEETLAEQRIVAENEELSLQLADEESPKFVHESKYPEVFFRNRIEVEKRKCIAVMA